MTKFQDKFTSLRQVNSPNSWEKFQICCTDMYLIRFLPNFAVFCVFLWISRLCDGAKYQKPWLRAASFTLHELATKNLHLATIFLQLVAKRRPEDFFNFEPWSYSIVLTLQRGVALKLVVANRPLWYHLQVISSRFSDCKDVAIAAHTVWEPGCFLRSSFTNFILFNTLRFRGQASILEKES